MRVGDKVRCDNPYGLSGMLHRDTVYTVEGVVASGYIKLIEVEGTWQPERFTVVTPPEPKLGIKAPNPVTQPSHYQSSLGIQVIDIIREWFPDNYNLGNVVKYLLRADKKGNRQQDLEKALQYLQWEVEHGRRNQ